MTPVGRNVRAIDWDAQTSGAFAYTADLAPPGMLHAAIVRSSHPHARIAGISLDRARAMPGVRAIITASDFPAGVRYLHEGAADRPPLADGVVRFVGQEIAALAADTAEQADAAALAIDIDYVPLAAPLDLDAATAVGAPLLHDRPHGLPNRAARYLRRWGDYRAGVAAARHLVSGLFHFPAQHHACMEPSAVLAHWNVAAARLELWSPTGAPHYVVHEVAHVMGLTPGQVVCREIGVGGSFGARTKVCDYEAIAGQLSRRASAPVRLILSRAEDFATTKSRHPFRMRMAVHGDDAGRLRAIDADIAVDNGAYSHSGGSVTSAALKGLGMLYQPDGVALSAELIDTAKRPGGQFRGYGTTQSAFALECLVDELAKRSGIDPLAYRIANANPPGSTTLVGARLGSGMLAACLAACGEAIGWCGPSAAGTAGTGIGFASAVHVSGSHVGGDANRSACAIDLHGDGRVHVRFGSGDAGTGQKTILAQIVAGALSVPLDMVSVEMIDSERTPFDMGSWSSRGTHYSGHAALTAAAAARDMLIAAAGPVTGEDARLTAGRIVGRNGSMAIGAAVMACPAAIGGILTVERDYVETAVEMADPRTGRGNISASYNFAGHAAKVAVSRRTGQVRLIDYVAAHDVGVAINPMMVEGQIIGGAAMGIGAALGEEVISEQGRMVNPAFVNYALPRAGDLPRIRALIVPGVDPAGPLGAKAVGETAINPPPAAIANAIHAAVGVRLRAPPFTPDKILTALNGAGWARRFPLRLWRRPGRWWIALVRRAYGWGLFACLHARMIAKCRPAPVPPLRDIGRPRSIARLGAAVRSGATPLGGGIDLLVRRRQRLLSADRFVSVADVAGFATIERLADGGWRIGAGATLAAIARAVEIPALAEAIATIASPQVRNVATLAGNLLQANRCWFLRNGFDCWKRRGGMAPCYAILGDHRFYHAAIGGHRCQSVTPSDLATVLTGLNATIIADGPAGRRRIPIGNLYVGPGETVLGEREIVLAVEIPRVDRSRMAFEKLALWDGDFAIASTMIVAARDAQDRPAGWRVVLGGMAPVPLRLAALERALDGDASPADVASVIAAALGEIAHPLPRNRWKLDAATGLMENALDRIAAMTSEHERRDDIYA